MRKKEISANKASKVYKIPSSTLYKIARKEGIELAQPFNAVATTWSQVNTAHTITVPPDPDSRVQDDLSTALEAIRGGMAVQKAATEFGIPSGTLYGRCKKVGIELSKNTQVRAGPSTDIVILIGTSTVTIHYADLGSLVQVHICRFTGPRTT